MFNSIWADVKREIEQGNMVTRLIIVNIVVWVIVILAMLFLKGFGWYDIMMENLMVSSDLSKVIFKPWTVITYMFLHEGIWHLFFNMLMFYWFGRIIGDFIGDHRILPLYILGGLMGVVFFYVSMNLMFPGTTFMCLGASAAVMAFIFAAATLSPNYEMRLILIGNVKIKYIALALLLIDLAFVGNNDNTGGHFSHMGGALMGSLYIWALRRGTDLALPLNQFFDWIKSLFESPAPREKRGTAKIRTLKPRKSRSVFGESHSDDVPSYEEMDYQERLDAILDKIKEQGFDKLSEEEKEFLSEASKK